MPRWFPCIDSSFHSQGTNAGLYMVYQSPSFSPLCVCICVCLTLSASMHGLGDACQGLPSIAAICGHLSTDEKAPGSRCQHNLLVKRPVPLDSRKSRPLDRSGALVPFGIVLLLRCRAVPWVPTAVLQWRHNRLLWGQNLI